MDQEDQVKEWYELYSQHVYQFLVYYNRTDDVDDLVQEVFIRAWKHAPSFKGKASPKTWLFSIARRVSIDRYRKKKWERLIDRGESHDVGLSPEDIVLNKEEDQRLYQAINSLKTKYREVVICRGILELSTRETADVLRWSTSKVDTTFYRAKEKLASVMDERGMKYARSQ
ncbi:RNA polymerase sigma factor [Pontibacillus salipaludis]|uniref:RNA polymerase sigma factor n=1 Tax=Pontibacillus salipaludis TaxID=1697394 RepID=A0ABQ1QC62_9BACI|nr:RNA polymerase sigma factor [Pontibacillus salipaludis]GGD21408.1 DNA-directed RNA polymerase sigma-70 factor [Pontibacillus salipaludis]